MKNLEAKFKMLCYLYDKSDENVSINTLLKVCFLDIDDLLTMCDKYQQVRLSYLCIQSIYNSIDYCILKNTSIKEYLNKVEEWLKCDGNLQIVRPRLCGRIKSCNQTCFGLLVFDITDIINNTPSLIKNYYIGNIFYSTIYFTDNKEKQKYKNIGFLISVLKNEP